MSDEVPVPLGPSAHQTFDSGPHEAGLSENWMSSANIWWLRSTNSQIYPGVYTIGGNWASGETAVCLLTWGDIALTFSHTALPGDTNADIARHLRQQMDDDPLLESKGITVEEAGQFGNPAIHGPNPWSWHINIDWPIFKQAFKLATNGSRSVNGAITPTPPLDILDTPGATIRVSRAVADRAAKPNDLIGNLSFEGQTDEPVADNVQQIYINLQAYVDNPDKQAPLGRLDIQGASSNENNVVTRFSFRKGLIIRAANGAMPFGGDGGDMGYGACNVADDYYVNGQAVMQRINGLEARLRRLETR